LKVLILNNDFRVYWKGRLVYLQRFLASQNISFYAIELFGNGSPYSFDTYDNNESWWTCLFPQNSSEELSKKDIEKALFLQLDKINPDIIIASSIVFYAGALGIRWAKKRKKKFVMFDDARHSQFKRKFLIQWVKDLIAEQADGFWFPSKNYYEAYAYFHNKGVSFFYGFNCIDNKLFKFEGEKQSHHKTIICVARLVPIKNIDNLLKSWQLIEKNNSDYKLVIIGDGPEYDILNQLKSDLNLKAVEFLGAIDNEVIPRYYFNAGAFILPSLSESWGLVVNEAMAAGLPVLLSHNVNAAKDLLKEGINGFGFDPLDVNSMADAISKYINSDIQAKKSMSNSSLEIIDLMSYENMGVQLFDALISIKQQKNKRPGLLASLVINLWYGRYNKSGWDKL
jgi:glycosyltransferase involved in cell wall biosynthesis